VTSVQVARDAAPFVREISHTADAGFEVTAPTLASCFERAALGLAAAIVELDLVSLREERRLDVRADDRIALLHDFLHAVLLLAQVDRFLVAGVEIRALNDHAVGAVLAGETLDPERHRLHGEVKAITWHDLTIELVGGAWRARVILDV
jgi:SHS2 domain-containing protein